MKQGTNDFYCEEVPVTDKPSPLPESDVLLIRLVNPQRRNGHNSFNDVVVFWGDKNIQRDALNPNDGTLFLPISDGRKIYVRTLPNSGYVGSIIVQYYRRRLEGE